MRDCSLKRRRSRENKDSKAAEHGVLDACISWAGWLPWPDLKPYNLERGCGMAKWLSGLHAAVWACALVILVAPAVKNVFVFGIYLAVVLLRPRGLVGKQ